MQAGFVQIDAADPGGTQAGAGGQLVEDVVADKSGVHTIQGGGEPLDDAGQLGHDRGKLRDHPAAAPRCCARSPRTAARVRLICVADPRQGWDPLLSQLFGLVPAHVPGGGGPQSGSRWSARSAARTNDLEAGEDPPQTWPAGGEATTLRFKSSAASWERRTCCGRQRRTCRRPALSGSTDEVRRHDDGWGARRCGLPKGCGRSVFAGGPPHGEEVAAGELRELAAGIS